MTQLPCGENPSIPALIPAFPEAGQGGAGTGWGERSALSWQKFLGVKRWIAAAGPSQRITPKESQQQPLPDRGEKSEYRCRAVLQDSSSLGHRTNPWYCTKTPTQTQQKPHKHTEKPGKIQQINNVKASKPTRNKGGDTERRSSRCAVPSCSSPGGNRACHGMGPLIPLGWAH